MFRLFALFMPLFFYHTIVNGDGQIIDKQVLVEVEQATFVANRLDNTIQLGLNNQLTGKYQTYQSTDNINWQRTTHDFDSKAGSDSGIGSIMGSGINTNNYQLDHAGFIHRVYIVKDGADTEDSQLRQIIYASNKTGQWQEQVVYSVDLATIKNIDYGAIYSVDLFNIETLATDDNGKVHFLLSEGDKLYYMSNVSGQWVKQVIYRFYNPIAGNVFFGSHYAMHISAAGQVSIVFSRTLVTFTGYYPFPLAGAVVYLKQMGAGWKIEIVDRSYRKTFAETNLVYDDNANPYVVYVAQSVPYFSNHRETQLLRWASKQGNRWQWQVITSDEQQTYIDLSVAIDQQNQLHIAFMYQELTGSTNNNYHSLHYISNQSGDWVQQLIDDNIRQGASLLLLDDDQMPLFIHAQFNPNDDNEILTIVSNGDGLN